MTSMRRLLAYTVAAWLVALVLPAPAYALGAQSPQEVVKAHFDAAKRSDYDEAFACFDTAFRKVFSTRVPEMRDYYGVLKGLLEIPPTIDPAVTLGDGGGRVKVTFGGCVRYYYLLLEGGAWKIDIFSDSVYESIADARRLAFLNTPGEWGDDGTLQLKALQGLYRIQQALESYRDTHKGRLPKSLSGGDSRDALIFGASLDEYPRNPFHRRPMNAVAFSDRMRGDFTYVPLDVGDDGYPRNYFLILYGPVASDEMFTDTNIVYELNSLFDADDKAILKALVGGFLRSFSVKLIPKPAITRALPDYNAILEPQKPGTAASPKPASEGANQRTKAAPDKPPGKWRIRAWGLP